MMAIITVQAKPQYFYPGVIARTDQLLFMNIEFNTTPGLLSEKLVREIRNAVMELYHINKKITKAEVLLHHDKKVIPADNKICEIKLSIFGESLMAHSREESFEAAARETIRELRRLLKQQVKRYNMPAEQITSSARP